MTLQPNFKFIFQNLQISLEYLHFFTNLLTLMFQNTNKTTENLFQLTFFSSNAQNSKIRPTKRSPECLFYAKPVVSCLKTIKRSKTSSRLPKTRGSRKNHYVHQSNRVNNTCDTCHLHHHPNSPARGKNIYTVHTLKCPKLNKTIPSKIPPEIHACNGYLQEMTVWNDISRDETDKTCITQVLTSCRITLSPFSAQNTIKPYGRGKSRGRHGV